MTTEKLELRQTKQELMRVVDKIRDYLMKRGHSYHIPQVADLTVAIMSNINALERTLNQIETEEFMKSQEKAV